MSREGMPLGYEVFAGNRTDVTTVEEIVEKIEGQYGAAGRIWVMDRGMVSEENLEYLRSGGRRYIVGTPKSQLKRFEQELLLEDWQQVREGLEVKLCPSPDGEESFHPLPQHRRGPSRRSRSTNGSRNASRKGWRSWRRAARRGSQKVGTVERRVGRLLEANSRAAGLFQVDVVSGQTAGRRWSGRSWRNGGPGH